MSEDVQITMVKLILDGEVYHLLPTGGLYLNPSHEPWPDKWVVQGNVLEIYN